MLRGPRRSWPARDSPAAAETVLSLSWSTGSAGGTALAGHVGVEGTRWADGSRRPLLLPLGRGDSSLGRLRQAHFLDWDVLYGYRVWFY